MSQNINFIQLPKGKPLEVTRLIGEVDTRFIQAHRHEYFEILWILSGEGFHSIDFVQYPLIPGRIYLITPGQIHESQRLADEVVIIGFQPDFVDTHYRSLLMLEQMFYQFRTVQPYITLDQKGEINLANIVSILNDEQCRIKPDLDLQRSLISSSLRYLIRYQPAIEIKSELLEERIIRLHILIDEHFRQHKETDFYSRQFSLTSKRVNELTRRQVGKTVTRLIHDRVVLEARRELAYTVKTIKSIAHGLGFEDSAYFCRFFRKLAGESPLSFRQRTFK